MCMLVGMFSDQEEEYLQPVVVKVFCSLSFIQVNNPPSTVQIPEKKIYIILLVYILKNTSDNI